MRYQASPSLAQVQKYFDFLSAYNFALPSGGTPIDQATMQFFIHAMKYFFNVETNLPRQRNEDERVPLDRFLLMYSTHYRCTREKAARLGVIIEPKNMTRHNILAKFLPNSKSVPFVPAHRLRLLVFTGKADLGLKAFRETLQPKMWSLYHELNHAILYRLLPPPDSILDDDLKNYLNLIESLASFRDLTLGCEVGNISSTLTQALIVYRRSDHKVPKLISRRLFQSYVAFRFFQLQGLDNTSIVKKMARKGVPLLHTPSPRDEFLDHLVPTWYASYLPAVRRALMIDRRKRSIPFKRLGIPLEKLGETLLDSRGATTLFNWYQNQFHTH